MAKKMEFELKYLVKWAKDYRLGCAASVKKNKHMNEFKGKDIKIEIVDAILVDFINFIAMEHGTDYALHTQDLVSKDE